MQTEYLQGGILRGHGRDHVRLLFFIFPGGGKAPKVLLSKLARWVTSASSQEEQRRTYRASGNNTDSLFVNLFLTSQGYARLGCLGFGERVRGAAQTARNGKFFHGGMAAAFSLDELSDRLVDWEDPYQPVTQARVGDPHLVGSPFDGMLLLARDREADLELECCTLRRLIEASGGQCLLEEAGKVMRQGPGAHPVEHFGYVDGVSNPELLPTAATLNRNSWDPSAPLEQVLVRDPFVPEEFGTLLVYRKLEQNVQLFRDLVASAVTATGLSPALIGAQMVGRFPDGTPTVRSSIPLGKALPDDTFTYQEDPTGTACPFFAHTRKVNPRLDGGTAEAERRRRRIVRRGITYGERETGLTDAPTGGVGLLFMAFMANIDEQFAFIQKRWANDASFLKAPTNIDPLIGQVLNLATGAYDPRSFSLRGSSFSWQSAVTMRGGEYFFAPSIPFLHNPLAG